MIVGQRKVKQTFFWQIDNIVDWAAVRCIIERAYVKDSKSTVRTGYDSLVMFKIELFRT